jgi:DNA recombination protein RmuC
MEIFSNLLLLVIGIIIGAIGSWLISRASEKQLVVEAVTDMKAQIAAKETQLLGQVQELNAVRKEMQSYKIQIENLQQQLRNEIASRSTAVEKANHIPRLEQQLLNRDVERKNLLAQISDLKAQQAQLQTTLNKERQATEEKLAILNEATKKLTD